MSAIETAAVVRRGAGLFRPESRGLIEVSGRDRSRWLDGMVSNEVASLSAGTDRSGCYAALLTRTGRIVADLHVLARPDAFWLELSRPGVAPVIEHLDRFIVADDVTLRDLSDAWQRLSLEGPAAAEILAAAGGPVPAEDGCDEATLGAASCVVAAYGFSGERAFQLFAAAEDITPLGEALRLAGAAHGLVEGDSASLEILRIEAGLPLLGAELDQTVLPQEAGLERAISTTKGCYTGQEVVARISSQGQVKHRLVGLSSQGADALPVGGEVKAGDRVIGEVTSSCVSGAGPIALAFVRRPHDEPGTELSVADRPARVTQLPFTGPASLA